MCFTLSTADDLPSYKELPVWTSLDGFIASSNFPSLRQLLLLIEVESIHWDAHKFGLRFEDSDDEAPSIVIPPLVTQTPVARASPHSR